MSLEIDDQVSDSDVAAVKAGLLAFNETTLGPARLETLNLVARNGRAVVGGLLGMTRWKWLYVDKLWVAEPERGKGLGRRLLVQAESIAKSRGCTHVSLDTFEFQARPFYEKLGYRLFGTLDDYPPGYRQYFLTKAL